MIAPLFSYRDLVKLVIDLDGRVDLNDSFMLRIADSWPKLRVLEPSDRSEGLVPTTTLIGLVPFLAACRELEDLSIRINAQPRLIFQEIGDPQHHKLRRLDVCTSLIEEPDVLELAALFPIAFPQLCQWPPLRALWDLSTRIDGKTLE